MLNRFSTLSSRYHQVLPDSVLTVVGTILSMTYGYTVKDCDDPLVILADECTTASVAAGGPGSLLCDLIPARTSPSAVVESVVTPPYSEILANVGSFLWIQEARGVYQVPCGQVLRSAVPVGEDSNGTHPCCDLRDGR